MILINLLPWREKEREIQKIRFLAVLGVAMCLSLLFVIGIYFYYIGQVRGQHEVNNFLRDEIFLLDLNIGQIKKLREEKEQLISRMGLVYQLETERTLTVKLFEELTQIIPNGVFLVDVHTSAGVIVLTGKAESNSRVSELMRNIDRSKWLSKPVLTEIKGNADEGDRLSRQFQLEMGIIDVKNKK